MTDPLSLETLGAQGLQRFLALQADAVGSVADRLHMAHGLTGTGCGADGREVWREDLAMHLEFLRPVLQFGLLQPMVDYLGWLASVLAARGIPAGHLGLSLDWLAEFFAEHMDAHDGAIERATLRAVVEGFSAMGGEPVRLVPPEPWPQADAFEAALLAGDQRRALASMNQCLDSGCSLVDFELHVIQPALYHIGDKWQANQVSVAQEHMATAIVQSVMTVGLLRAPPTAALDKRVLLACVEGNNHAVGLRMVADAFQLAGWDVQYLGASVPGTALVQQAALWKPHLIGLSVSFAQQMRVVKATIALLDARLGATRPAVLIGGLAINRFEPLARMVGADGFSADPGAALSDARRMVGL